MIKNRTPIVIQQAGIIQAVEFNIWQERQCRRDEVGKKTDHRSMG